MMPIRARCVAWADGLDLIEAEGRFMGGAGCRSATRRRQIEADRIFLVTGTRTAVPQVEGVDRVRPT